MVTVDGITDGCGLPRALFVSYESDDVTEAVHVLRRHIAVVDPNTELGLEEQDHVDHGPRINQTAPDERFIVAKFLNRRGGAIPDQKSSDRFLHGKCLSGDGPASASGRRAMAGGDVLVTVRWPSRDRCCLAQRCHNPMADIRNCKLRMAGEQTNR
jgi:hypothetical protein